MATVEPVVTEQPEQELEATAANGSPTTAAKTGIWSTGLCGCCGDMSSCCLGTCCCPILGCQVSKKMGECCCAGCIAASLRTKYRKEHDIQGTACNDCYTSCFCGPCVLCQLTREIKRSQPTTTT